MRIVYLLPDPGIPVGGEKGASVHVAAVTGALVRAGHAVMLVAMRAAGSAPEGVELLVLEPGPLPGGPQGDARRAAAVARFFSAAEPAIRVFRPELLYERLSLFAGDGAGLAGRLGGVPRLVEINAPVTAERAGYRGVADAGFGERLERLALAGAHAVAVSPPLAAWARTRGVAHVTVVSNGVDVARFAPDSRRAGPVRRALRLEGCEVVGFAGSLKPWHGVDVLLDAAARLAPRRPRLRLLVVGDGPERGRLERLAAESLGDRARFTGAVPPDAVPDHLAVFDVAAAPYLPPASGVGFYFSPLKVVEAMAAGLPVVASRFRPIETLLAGHGRLVPAADAAALAGAIAGALDDPQSPEEAAAVRGLAAAHDWNAVIRRLLDVAAAAGAGRPAGGPDPEGTESGPAVPGARIAAAPRRFAA